VTKICDFIVDFLREFEAVFKKALTRARVSGASGELFYEKKTRGRKSRIRVPLKVAQSGLFDKKNQGSKVSLHCPFKLFLY
jgi:hypothetical protein